MASSALQVPRAAGFRLGQRPALDGVRGCAILAVMAQHARLVRGGFFGVDVFFVLSGFLITALLLQEWDATGAVSLPRFYLRRALRLLPALCALILVSWLFAWLVCGPVDEWLTRRSAVAVLLYYFNWEVILHPWPYQLLLHAWSLSVEEQFYLVWPVLLVLLLRRGVRRGWILAFVLAGIAAVNVERTWLLHRGATPHRFYFGTDTRLDVLLVGCLLGLLASWDLLPRKAWPRTILRVAGPVAAVALVWHGYRFCSWDAYVIRHGFLVVAVCTGILLASLLRQPPRLLNWLLERPLLGWIGRISYGLYLWHVLIFWQLVPLSEKYLSARGILHAYSPTLRVLLSVAGSLAVASLSYYLIERPFLALKRKFDRRPGPPAESCVTPPPAVAA